MPRENVLPCYKSTGGDGRTGGECRKHRKCIYSHVPEVIIRKATNSDLLRKLDNWPGESAEKDGCPQGLVHLAGAVAVGSIRT